MNRNFYQIEVNFIPPPKLKPHEFLALLDKMEFSLTPTGQHGLKL